MEMTDVKSRKLDKITEKPGQLSETELDHAEKFLDALFTEERKPFDRFRKIFEIDRSGTCFKMRLGVQTENMYGVAQGGSVFSLSDIAISFHLIEKLPKDVKVFTFELKMNFIKGVKGDYLLAKPKILRLGNTTAVTECEITDDQGELVAKAFGTFYLKRT